MEQQMKVDPVTLALIQNRLDHVARQMGQVMLRTARSPIFNQSHDFSCFITDGHGCLISQADGIPIHTGGGSLIVQHLLDAFSGEIQPDDAFISSDPYVAGGNHLPDWVVSRPVFVGNNLFAFVCNRAHQSDIGGGAAGTYNPRATEIFHEGIRLPPLRLVEREKIREDVWNLLLLNSRCPDLLDGDLRAMLGSTRIGTQHICAMAEDYGNAECAKYIEAILDYGDRRMRTALSALPNGVYRGAEKSDNDCFSERDVWIRVSLTKTEDKLVVDFDGTDAQIRGFKNSSLSNTRSAVYVAVTSFLDPTIPRNEGTYRSIEVLAPLGTVVNPRPPAPLTMCTVLPAHEIIHACWMALAQAVPQSACAGWGKVTHCNMAGQTANGSTYVMYHWGAMPASGAVAGRDGLNQIGPLNSLGNLVVPNCETYEQLYPVHFLRQEFRRDACGPGEFRGGTGVDYAVKVEGEAEYAFRGEGQRTPSGYGILGGSHGAAGSVEFVFPDGRRMVPPQFGLQRLGPVEVRISSPAGGGWGDPKRRDPERVLRDVRDGVLSPEIALRDYAVAISADRRRIDEERTRQLRLSAASAAGH
jgi:N-methylhydantoinase B